MAANISHIASAFEFVINVTSVCYSLLQIYEVYYIFEGF
jgi:hypothetical protein